ncbi:MAG: polysaccharide deacetylase family protein [Telluria sp.]
MLNVFFTVDVEIWCDGWQDIDRKFPGAYRKYIHGTTKQGDFGLPYQLKVLGDHQLNGVFFIEPLFSARFGSQPLAEIVGMVNDARQDAELHLHTEWVGEAPALQMPDVSGKRQFLRDFSLAEQCKLIGQGADMLRTAGVKQVNAFRAGSFGFNRDSLTALAANHIGFDSSYNASMFGPSSGVLPGVEMTEPANIDGVWEVPMTVFNDGTSKLRHTQLTSCSSLEMEGLLWQALEQRRGAFVILSHGAELLNVAKDRADPVAVKRFRKLCAFLDKNRDCFHTSDFRNPAPPRETAQRPPLTSPLYRTGMRLVEQAYRRRFK